MAGVCNECLVLEWLCGEVGPTGAEDGHVLEWICGEVGPTGAEDGYVQTPGLKPGVKTCNGPGAV